MRIKKVMTPNVRTCEPSDPMSKAARIMWEEDCGVVPVVEEKTRQLVGMVTDRDLCMAVHTRCRPLEKMRVDEAMGQELHTCRESQDLRSAHAAMRRYQVRRLPVVDGDHHLVGVVSLNDLALHVPDGPRGASARENVAQTLAAISAHRATDELQ